jgi:hypothetical protein
MASSFLVFFMADSMSSLLIPTTFAEKQRTITKSQKRKNTDDTTNASLHLLSLSRDIISFSLAFSSHEPVPPQSQARRVFYFFMSLIYSNFTPTPTSKWIKLIHSK